MQALDLRCFYWGLACRRLRGGEVEPEATLEKLPNTSSPPLPDQGRKFPKPSTGYPVLAFRLSSFDGVSRRKLRLPSGCLGKHVPVLRFPAAGPGVKHRKSGA